MSYKAPNNIIVSKAPYHTFEWNTVKVWAVGYKWGSQNILSIYKKYRTLYDAMTALRDYNKNKQHYFANEFLLLKVDYSDIKPTAKCYQETQPKYIEINHIFLREEKLKRILK